MDRIKFQSKLLPNGHKDKITNFDSSFKFPLTYINTKHYVLALKFVDSNKVIKISYFLNSVVDIFVTDTLLSGNIVSRAYGNTVFLIENSNVVYSKQALRFRPISKPKITCLPGTKCHKESFIDTNKSIENLFGFYYCSVVSPQNSYFGLLPFRGKNGLTFPLLVCYI